MLSEVVEFWSSVELTGNQTLRRSKRALRTFWSSVELTGNQTRLGMSRRLRRFGAVSN